MAASLRPHPPRYTVSPAQGSHGQLRLVPSNGENGEQPQPDFHQGNAVEPRGRGQLQLASGRYNPYPVFNSRQNYIRAGMRGAITRSTQQSLSIHSTAGRGTARRTSGHATVGRKFNRTVVIVDPSDVSVPRGKRRRQLHELGLIVNFVDFWTNWTEADVFHAIESAFQGALDIEKPYPRWVRSECIISSVVSIPDHFWHGRGK